MQELRSGQQGSECVADAVICDAQGAPPLHERLLQQVLGGAAMSKLGDEGPENESGLIGTEQMEAMVRAVEASLEVRRRYQFFVWTQSNLQALLPHQLAVCGAYQRQCRELEFEVFNSVSLPASLLECLADPRSALMLQLQGRWIDQRCKPLLLRVDSLAGLALAPICPALNEAGFGELLVHGVSRPQRPSEIESFFVFASSGRGITGQQRMMMELLMPYLHGTWLRVQATERELNDTPRSAQLRRPPSSGITEREREILCWLREGMSNQQIGEQLSISALTVKNHVQKILRKLNAANRAQAVARAMSMSLLGPAGSGQEQA